MTTDHTGHPACRPSHAQPPVSTSPHTRPLSLSRPLSQQHFPATRPHTNPQCLLHAPRHCAVSGARAVLHSTARVPHPETGTVASGLRPQLRPWQFCSSGSRRRLLECCSAGRGPSLHFDGFRMVCPGVSTTPLNVGPRALGHIVLAPRCSSGCPSTSRHTAPCERRDVMPPGILRAAACASTSASSVRIISRFIIATSPDAALLFCFGAAAAVPRNPRRTQEDQAQASCRRNPCAAAPAAPRLAGRTLTRTPCPPSSKKRDAAPCTRAREGHARGPSLTRRPPSQSRTCIVSLACARASPPPRLLHRRHRSWTLYTSRVYLLTMRRCSAACRALAGPRTQMAPVSRESRPEIGVYTAYVCSTVSH